MPIIRSAIKKMRQDIKRTKRNIIFRNRLKSRLKELKKAVLQKNTEKLPELMRKSYSIIDMAFKKNLIKRNTAARRKSLIARLVNTAITCVTQDQPAASEV